MDENYGVSPIPVDYNGSVYFTEEVINVTYDSSKAYMHAQYIFKNNCTENVDLHIRLPFIVYDGPDDIVLSEEKHPLDYSWVNTTVGLEFFDDYYEFKAIEFFLSFEPYEKITVTIQYSREYEIDDSTMNSFIYYSFGYIIGTAKTWNHPLDSALFEFWIPKSICDDSFLLSKQFAVTVEPKHYVASVEYLNWIPEHDVIDIYWHKLRPFGLTPSHISLFLNGLGVALLPLSVFVVLIILRR